jgi:hypothetical protein
MGRQAKADRGALGLTFSTSIAHLAIGTDSAGFVI